MSHLIRLADATEMPAIAGIVHDCHVGYVARIALGHEDLTDPVMAVMADKLTARRPDCLPLTH